MPEIVVRPYEDRDRDEAFSVLALTYNDGREIEPEERRWRLTAGYVAVLDGRIVGVYGILPLTCTRGEAVLTHGGIAGVAVLPEHRRTGVGSAMLRYAPGRMRAEGLHLGSLYAYREAWYRKFGFEVAGRRLEIKCPVSRLPKVRTDLPIRRLGPGDWRIFQPCFEAWAKERSGMSLRSETLWGRFLNESKPNAIYVAGDPVEGYVALSHQTAFWADQRLSEVVWSTERGYQACLEIMTHLGINKESLTWYEPSDSPFYTRHLDQGITVRLERPIMFRVNDVPESLRRLKPRSEGRFTVAVDDELVPENRGPWSVVYSPEEVRVEPADDADIALDIRQWTQAFLGEPSLEDLRRLGLVGVRNQAGFASAAQLLTPLPTYCGEFF
ncbi:MAG TPA: GNAT family N-acetyltransferase [Fimbriimonas sp.]